MLPVIRVPLYVRRGFQMKIMKTQFYKLLSLFNSVTQFGEQSMLQGISVSWRTTQTPCINSLTTLLKWNAGCLITCFYISVLWYVGGGSLLLNSNWIFILWQDAGSWHSTQPRSQMAFWDVTLLYSSFGRRESLEFQQFLLQHLDWQMRGGGGETLQVFSPSVKNALVTTPS